MKIVLSDPKPGSYLLERYDGRGISKEMVSEAAKLFSREYGIWGSLASEKMGEGKEKGSRIKISSRRLITQILPPEAQNMYLRLLTDGKLAGNVFATRWRHENLPILWITQLCVDSKYRNQGVAKKMLGYLKGEEEMVGILSSHPFALMAVLKVWGRGVENVRRDLEMMKGSVKEVMEGCPVGYVKVARLRGSLFGEGDRGAVACADTQFWVDHEEPLEALRKVEERGIVWPFEELPDGCEFLVLVDAKVVQLDYLSTSCFQGSIRIKTIILLMLIILLRIVFSMSFVHFCSPGAERIEEHLAKPRWNAQFKRGMTALLDSAKMKYRLTLYRNENI